MKIIISERQFNKILDSLLNESISSQKQKWVDSGESKDEVDKYIELYTKYKKEGKFKMENPFIKSFKETYGVKDIENIDTYQNFKSFKSLIDYFKNQDESQSKPVDIGMVDSETLVDNETIKIQRGNTGQGCIDIKGDFDTSWCVASKGNNLYGKYRYGQEESTFYFVQNKRLFNSLNIKSREEINNLNDKNKYCFFVIQVTNKENLYIVTSASNDGDKGMNWEQIIDIYPELNKYKNYINVVPISDEERKYSIPIDELEPYLNFTYHEKLIYLRQNILTDEQFENTNPKLLEEYVKGIYRLTDKQKELIYSDVNTFKPNKKYYDVAYFYKFNVYEKFFHDGVILDIDLFKYFANEFYDDNIKHLEKNGINFKDWVFTLNNNNNRFLFLYDYCIKFREDNRVINLVGEKFFKDGDILHYKIFIENINEFYDIHMKYLDDNGIDFKNWFLSLDDNQIYYLNDYCEKFKEDNRIINLVGERFFKDGKILNEKIFIENINEFYDNHMKYLEENGINFKHWYYDFLNEYQYEYLNDYCEKFKEDKIKYGVLRRKWF